MIDQLDACPDRRGAKRRAAAPSASRTGPGTAALQTAMFMQLVIAGHLLLFSTRARGFFFQPPWPEWRFFCAIMGTQVFAAFMAAHGWLVTPISWELIGKIWLYNLVLAARDRPRQDRHLPAARGRRGRRLALEQCPPGARSLWRPAWQGALKAMITVDAGKRRRERRANHGLEHLAGALVAGALVSGTPAAQAARSAEGRAWLA